MYWNHLVIGKGRRWDILKLTIFLKLGIILCLFYVFFEYVGNVNFFKQA